MLMPKMLLPAIALAMVSVLPAYAQQSQPCGPRREVIDSLKSRYGETESWFGHIAGQKNAVALLLTGKNGSWTLLQVTPDVACGVASGNNSTLMFGDPA